MEKMWTKCADCRAKLDQERYEAMPIKEWQGEPVVSYRDENYMFSEEEVYDFVRECEAESRDPMLVICEPICAPFIEEYGIDQLPDDWTIDDADSDLGCLINAVNKYVSEKKPILSWTQGRSRTTIRQEKGMR